MRKSPSAQRGQARVKIPQRNQVEMQQLSLDEWLAADHRARIVWKYAESVDLSSLYDSLKAVQGGVGRDGIDPRILFSLWLLATLEGITSARTLAKLTIRDIAYMWICGGVSVNYHRLADFRVEHGDLLEQIMVDSIGVLLHHQLIQLETVAQDGMRVRANAGSSSFRRRGSLEKALENARMHVEQLKEASQADPAASNRRRQAAQERTAREQVERLEAARESLAKLEEQRKERSKRGDAPKSEPRASTTDADARCMKMGDGGWRPALNVQFASDGHARVIVGVDITNQGTDSGLIKPMCEQLKDIYDAAPEAYIVDGGYTKATDVTQLEQEGTAVYAPVYREQQQLAEGKNPYAHKAHDTPEMGAFRERMGTDEAKATLKTRPSIAEFPNADCRNRGLIQFRVRGLVKAKAQTLWHVLAFNFCRFLNLDVLKTVIQGKQPTA